jgi:plastocyanin domain-containing protein
VKSLFILLALLSTGPVAFATQTGNQIVELHVTEKGFEPDRISVKPGVPVILKITRTTDKTCAKQIKISSRNIKRDLPLSKAVTIELGKLEKGDIAFACGMDMFTGHIIVQ